MKIKKMLKNDQKLRKKSSNFNIIYHQRRLMGFKLRAFVELLEVLKTPQLILFLIKISKKFCLYENQKNAQK